MRYHGGCLQAFHGASAVRLALPTSNSPGCCRKVWLARQGARSLGNPDCSAAAVGMWVSTRCHTHGQHRFQGCSGLQYNLYVTVSRLVQAVSSLWAAGAQDWPPGSAARHPLPGYSLTPKRRPSKTSSAPARAASPNPRSRRCRSTTRGSDASPPLECEPRPTTTRSTPPGPGGPPAAADACRDPGGRAPSSTAGTGPRPPVQPARSAAMSARRRSRRSSAATASAACKPWRSISNRLQT